MRWLQALSISLLALTIAAGLTSCAGQGTRGRHRSGSVVMRIIWPSATRAIPLNARSLKAVAVTLIKGPNGQTVEDTVVGQKVVSRPAGQSESSLVLDDIPSVKVRIKVTAHASIDGTGPVLASGQADVAVTEGSATPANIELNGGTILHLSNVGDGEIQGPCGHFSIWAEDENGDPVSGVTWTVTRGEFLNEGPGQIRYRVPLGSGPDTITATLTSDPTVKASATVIVDDLVGIWDGSWGRMRISRPSSGTEKHAFNGGELLHSGTSFSGSYPSGTSEPVQISGTISGNTMTGTTTFTGASTPFTETRTCPEWP